MRRSCCLLFFLGWCVLATAQPDDHFQLESRLSVVDQDGFYKILLRPEQLGVLTSDLSDIRIYDSAGGEVPYLLEQEHHREHFTLFRKYEILEEKRVPERYSVYTVHNPDKKAINNLNLIIKNAEVRKDMRLLGSEDLQEWFAVKEISRISSINNQRGTSEIKLLDFPLSNYKYFRLEISDSTSSPIQITSIGYYEHFSKSGNYREITPVAVVQQDIKKEKISVIAIAFAHQQLIDQLELEVEGSSFYYRNARLEVKKMADKKAYYQLVAQFPLSSSTPHIVTLGGIKADNLRLVIENADNPPLEVSAKAWQLNRYLLADLQKEKSYTLRLGNKNIGLPNYDLHYFRDSLPAHLPVIEPLDMKALASTVSLPASKSFFSTTLYIWAAIIFAAGLLGYITFKMVTEMEK